MPAVARPKGPRHHFMALDGLRGIAALLVVFCHCAEVDARIGDFNPPTNWHRADITAALVYSPLHLLWDGEDAVIFFFVLSGFVLSLSYLNGKALSYPSYIIRRFFRLYPALISSILFSCFVLLLTHPFRDAALSTWLPGQGGSTISVGTVAGHFLLLGGNKYQWLDVPIWSLVHEVRISIIFPFLMLVLRRTQLGFVILSIGIFASAVSVSHFATLGPLSYVLMRTFHYIVFFAFGALLANNRITLIKAFSSLSSQSRALMLLVAFLLFCARWVLPIGATAADILAAVGSALLIVCALSFSIFGGWLSGPLSSWLGRISYSLYLIHMPVLAMWIYLLLGRLSLATIALLTVPSSLFIAHLMAEFIERPGILVGRKLAAPAAKHRD